MSEYKGDKGDRGDRGEKGDAVKSSTLFNILLSITSFLIILCIGFVTTKFNTIDKKLDVIQSIVSIQTVHEYRLDLLEERVKADEDIMKGIYNKAFGISSSTKIYNSDSSNKQNTFVLLPDMCLALTQRNKEEDSTL